MATLSLTFSEPMNRTSLAVSTLPAATLSAASWDASGRTATFTPNNGWQSDTTYVVTIDGADLAMNLLPTATVTFRSIDITPPIVTRSVPLPDAGDVDVMTNVNVTFSEPMRPGSGISLSPDAGCVPTLDPANTRLSCNNGPLAPLTNYVVTVGGMSDLAGNPMVGPFTMNFRTAFVPDTTRPTIVSMLPIDASTGARTTEPMVVTFSEPMDPAATQNAFAVSSPTGVSVTFSWSTDGRTMTASPTAAFPFGQIVRWQINTLAADLAGNRLLTLQQSGFQVRRSFTANLTPIASGGTLSPTTNLTVGDDAANQVGMAFLVYSLPVSSLEILSGTFTATQYPAALNAPYSDNSSPLNISLEGIAYSSPLDSTEVTAAPFCVTSPIQCVTLCSNSIPFSTSLATPNSSSSASFVRVLNIGRAQPGSTFALRLRRRYPSPGCGTFGSDNDNVTDSIRFYGPSEANAPTLSITYTAP